MSERELEGVASPPMENGELVFDAPWQGRLFGMAHTLAGQGVFEWDEFRAELIRQIKIWDDAEDGVSQRHASSTATASYSYYEHFGAALEAILAARGFCTSTELEARTQTLAARPHGHDH